MCAMFALKTQICWLWKLCNKILIDKTSWADKQAKTWQRFIDFDFRI